MSSVRPFVLLGSACAAAVVAGSCVHHAAPAPAISFLSRDARIAEELADLLSPGLRVFVYPRNQEDLLGGDGHGAICASLRSRLSPRRDSSPWAFRKWA